MSLEKADQVDLVSVNAQGDMVTVHIVATEPWKSDGTTTLLLQAKLKSSLVFACEGQLHQMYPKTRGKRVQVEIRTAHPLGELEEHLVTLARSQWFEPEGIGLVVTPLRSA